MDWRVYPSRSEYVQEGAVRLIYIHLRFFSETFEDVGVGGGIPRRPRYYPQENGILVASPSVQK